MRLLFIGDVVGQSGCEFLMEKLPDYKKENNVDVCRRYSTPKTLGVL